MKTPLAPFVPAIPVALLALASIAALAFTGCVAAGPAYPSRGPSARVAVAASYHDDYVYYPAHETYYSSTRHEYIYRDGNSWVRRPQPYGVSADVIVRTPSVRLDFHDSPEAHHEAVVKQYPRNWRHDQNQNGIDDRLEQRRN